jgi:peptide/nickel transport system substrate-binding protein
VLNLGLRTILDGFAIAASATLSGGGLGYIEMHSQALFTSDRDTGRPIPRLLTEQPTVENGGLNVTPDGKMISTYKLRPDVKWADGQPLTSRDLMFTYNLTRDKTMPIVDPTAGELMESATAPDDRTFQITWKQPFYLADAMGLQMFWPLPAHLLEADYKTIVEGQKDAQAFMAKPFWTSESVHVGPFRLVEFNAGVEAAFEAVDHYFLGRPKVDRIVVKQFSDNNTLLASVLAGSVDMSTDNALLIEQSLQLKQRWDMENGGKVQFSRGVTWFVSWQFDPSVPQINPQALERPVRQALYQAIDRDANSEANQAGVQGQAADSVLSPDHPLYGSVKDGWRNRYPYDLNRAMATLESAGWRRGPDGVFVHPTLGRLTAESRTTQGNDRDASVVADMWRKLGADVEEHVIPTARVRDREYRQQFPFAELTARGNEEVVLTRLECPLAPTRENSFSGNNRGHWCNAEFDRLAGQFRATLREQDRGPIISRLQEIMLDELPIGLLYYRVSAVLARRGVTAFDDFKGGGDSGRPWGSYSRNAHEWDLAG